MLFVNKMGEVFLSDSVKKLRGKGLYCRFMGVDLQQTDESGHVRNRTSKKIF